MAAFNLSATFPKKVLREAAKVSTFLEKPGAREDLRKKFIFTCDPQSARDYDDALSLDKDPSGNLVLGVHIADVAHFVRPGSALDNEAYKRGTSVYLAEKVVPMLPEELSNGVCSLVPGEDRLAFSCFMVFSKDGRMLARRFAKTIIRSKARFTSEQVLRLLTGKGKTPGVKTAWIASIRKISRLAQTLRKKRFAAGALDLAVPEAEVVLDENHEMVDLKIRANDIAHQMVEECMIAANEAVATELRTRGIKFLARFHAKPDEDKLQELEANLKHLGIKTGNLAIPKNLKKLLSSIQGHPLEGIISVMILRSMKKALYDAKEIGHWGLAKRYYAHFTSPIRRYPDLTLHRQLASFIAGTGGRADPAYLSKAAIHTSEKEIEAAEAERNMIEVKKYRYLEKHPGPYEAVVVKVVKFGVFVDLPSLAASGMVHIRNLAREYILWDEAAEELHTSSHRWHVGTRMRVMVDTVDYTHRWIDFIPA